MLRKSASRVKQAKQPQVTETPDKKKNFLAAQAVMQYVGWTSRLMQNPNVATENVRNSAMHNPSWAMRNPCQRVYGSLIVVGLRLRLLNSHFVFPGARSAHEWPHRHACPH